MVQTTAIDGSWLPLIPFEDPCSFVHMYVCLYQGGGGGYVLVPALYFWVLAVIGWVLVVWDNYASDNAPPPPPPRGDHAKEVRIQEVGASPPPPPGALTSA